jgi:hypothetical protein
MEWLMNNWYLVIAFVVVGIVIGISIKKWFDQPTDAQVASIKQWLLFAVTEAEKALGGKTGQLKLHMVYDMAIAKFSWLSIIPFETFGEWVDEALVDMQDMLKNEHINAIVQDKK